MKTLKRTLAALLALTSMMGLAACGGGSTSETATEDSSAYKEADDYVADASLAADYIQNDPQDRFPRTFHGCM